MKKLFAALFLVAFSAQVFAGCTSVGVAKALPRKIICYTDTVVSMIGHHQPVAVIWAGGGGAGHHGREDATYHLGGNGGSSGCLKVFPRVTGSIRVYVGQGGHGGESSIYSGYYVTGEGGNGGNGGGIIWDYSGAQQYAIVGGGGGGGGGASGGSSDDVGCSGGGTGQDGEGGSRKGITSSVSANGSGHVAGTDYGASNGDSAGTLLWPTAAQYYYGHAPTNAVPDCAWNSHARAGAGGAAAYFSVFEDPVFSFYSYPGAGGGGGGAPGNGSYGTRNPGSGGENEATSNYSIFPEGAGGGAGGHYAVNVTTAEAEWASRAYYAPSGLTPGNSSHPDRGTKGKGGNAEESSGISSQQGGSDGLVVLYFGVPVP